MSQTVFLFPGQGAQHVGMGQKLCDELPAARALFDQAAEVLGYDLRDVCFNGPEEKLNATEFSQPALFVCSLAALELLRLRRPELCEECSLTAGLSLGEYTALTFAGALSFEDGLRVVQKRGEAMQRAADAAPSGMTAVLVLGREDAENICRQAADAGRIWVANYLCPGNTVLSGEIPACERAEQLAAERNGRASRLAVAGAFHTELMQSAVDELQAALANVEIRSPRIPVVSNVDARPHSDPEEIRRLLVQQVVRPVLWEDSIRWMIDRGADAFYEVGPGAVLRGLMKRIDRKMPFETVNDASV